MQSQSRKEASPDGRHGSGRNSSRDSSSSSSRSRMQRPSLAPKVRPFSLSFFLPFKSLAQQTALPVVLFRSQKVFPAGQPVDTTFFLEEAASLLRNGWTPSLWLPPRLPFRSIMLSERLERNCSGERPANGGPGFPPSHLPALKTKHSVPLTHCRVVKSN